MFLSLSIRLNSSFGVWWVLMYFDNRTYVRSSKVIVHMMYYCTWRWLNGFGYFVWSGTIWLFDEAKIIFSSSSDVNNLRFARFTHIKLKIIVRMHSRRKTHWLAKNSGTATRSSFHLSHFTYYTIGRIFNFRAPGSVDFKMNSVKIYSMFTVCHVQFLFFLPFSLF